ncbi:PREDICTED: uncharacterized protein LOC103335391 [Prunus mume]|uniref:Uncharacterized protein LOC103335391 n=1 Tax=Prunus mume TaxID=102107 RepID=A0ABM0PA95_PRUMU|nr:PREDICTED: uncharacterized protein LOC103335391 [Prunus mume]
MELELQGQPGSSGSGSSGSHVVSIHDEELPRHPRFLSPSTVDYNAYHRLRPPEQPKDVNKDIMSSLQKQVDDHNKPKHRTKFTYSEKWIFFLISLGLETISASLISFHPRVSPTMHYMVCCCLLRPYSSASVSSFTRVTEKELNSRSGEGYGGIIIHIHQTGFLVIFLTFVG